MPINLYIVVRIKNYASYKTFKKYKRKELTLKGMKIPHF
jgi:hypothetical protein